MRGGICGYQLCSSTEIKAQLSISQIKMPITTCQKVTLISCSVLCVSLFLPRIFLPARKKEMGKPEGKSSYQSIIIIISHHPVPSPSGCACVSLMSLLLWQHKHQSFMLIKKYYVCLSVCIVFLLPFRKCSFYLCIYFLLINVFNVFTKYQTSGLNNYNKLMALQF